MINGGTNYDLTFSLDCGASIGSSALETPPVVSYNSSGDKIIDLTVIDSDGDVSFAVDTVTLTGFTAPEISFDFQNQCISVLTNFTVSNSGLSSYSWDFDGDGIEDSFAENPSFDYSTLGTGTYTVRLDVEDGTCGNFYEEDITIYDVPPQPVVGATSTTECSNTAINFVNSTDESDHTGVISYAWDFDSDGSIDSTDPSPSYAYPISGDYTVSVVSVIPGCESSVSTIEVTILQGPTSSFFATSACQGEIVEFTNTSTDDISWSWDFKDGSTSTVENPTHIFSQAGNYFVDLTVVDASGCTNLSTVEVVIADVPEVVFDYGVLCTSSQGNLFQDQSTVNNSDIISWSWRVDGNEVSTDQNPTLTFANPGVVNIDLAVVSGNGCESLVTEQVEVFAAPIPDFNASINCIGAPSIFEDLSTAGSSLIESWVWDVNGTTYLTQDIEHVFDGPGIYEVTLEVGAQNFCSESITRSVEVLALPEVDFTADGTCDNETVTLSESTLVFNDPIVSKRWLLGGELIGNGSNATLESLPSGNYEVAFQIETENGCQVTTVRQLTIESSPASAFEVNKNYGVPGDAFTFSNQSTGGSSFRWLEADRLIGITESIESISFDEPGNYDVRLVAFNELGCSDTTLQEIIVRVPEVDLRIRNFDLIEEGSDGRVLVEIENRGNLPIDATRVQLTLEDQFSISETIEEVILAGESQLVELNTRIPLSVSQAAYFCVELISQYVDYPDLDPNNNEQCITIEPSIVVEDPFPNPVIDQLVLRVISPGNQNSTVRVISSAGSVKIQKAADMLQGLNNVQIDMSLLDAGIYFVIVELNGSSFKKKILKL